jgi:thymidylate kinase
MYEGLCREMVDPRKSVIDPTNLARDIDTLIICFEGLTGSGKSTLISNIKRTCREIGRHHDLYMDRFSASLWVYGREAYECLKLEEMLEDRAIYVYISVDPDIAWKRESEEKKKVYKISEQVFRQTLENFDYYFTNICILPVLVIDGDKPIDIPEVLDRLGRIHDERKTGTIINPFKIGWQPI